MILLILPQSLAWLHMALWPVNALADAGRATSDSFVLIMRCSARTDEKSMKPSSMLTQPCHLPLKIANSV